MRFYLGCRLTNRGLRFGIRLDTVEQNEVMDHPVVTSRDH